MRPVGRLTPLAMLSRAAGVLWQGCTEFSTKSVGDLIPPWSSWVWNKHPWKSRYRFRELFGCDPAALGVNFAQGQEDAFGVTSLLYTLFALTIWYTLKFFYVIFALVVTPLSLNLVASIFLSTGVCTAPHIKHLPWASWHLITTAWGVYCVYLCGRLRHLLPTFFATLILLCVVGARQASVKIWGQAAYDYISPSFCPTIATHPSIALVLHLLYLTVADWCAEICRHWTDQGLAPNTLPLLPRLHQSLVLATQPWWELLPVTWALRLRMSRLFAAVKTIWWMIYSIVVWCFGLRKRWRSGLVLAIALFWADSGQDVGQLGWSAAQAAVALCIWSVTTFWGLVFTPVILAIVGMMYWDDIEVRLRLVRGNFSRWFHRTSIFRWARRRRNSGQYQQRQSTTTTPSTKLGTSKSTKGKQRTGASAASGSATGSTSGWTSGPSLSPATTASALSASAAARASSPRGDTSLPSNNNTSSSSSPKLLSTQGGAGKTGKAKGSGAGAAVSSMRTHSPQSRPSKGANSSSSSSSSAKRGEGPSHASSHQIDPGNSVGGSAESSSDDLTPRDRAAAAEVSSSRSPTKKTASLFGWLGLLFASSPPPPPSVTQSGSSSSLPNDSHSSTTKTPSSESSIPPPSSSSKPSASKQQSARQQSPADAAHHHGGHPAKHAPASPTSSTDSASKKSALPRTTATPSGGRATEAGKPAEAAKKTEVVSVKTTKKATGTAVGSANGPTTRSDLVSASREVEKQPATATAPAPAAKSKAERKAKSSTNSSPAGSSVGGVKEPAVGRMSFERLSLSESEHQWTEVTGKHRDKSEKEKTAGGSAEKTGAKGTHRREGTAPVATVEVAVTGAASKVAMGKTVVVGASRPVAAADLSAGGGAGAGPSSKMAKPAGDSKVGGLAGAEFKPMRATAIPVSPRSVTAPFDHIPTTNAAHSNSNMAAPVVRVVESHSWGSDNQQRNDSIWASSSGGGIGSIGGGGVDRFSSGVPINPPLPPGPPPADQPYTHEFAAKRPIVPEVPLLVAPPLPAAPALPVHPLPPPVYQRSSIDASRLNPISFPSTSWASFQARSDGSFMGANGGVNGLTDPWAPVQSPMSPHLRTIPPYHPMGGMFGHPLMPLPPPLPVQPPLPAGPPPSKRDTNPLSMLSMMPSLSAIGGGGGGQDTSGSWANVLKGTDGEMVLPGSVGQGAMGLVDRSGLSLDGSLVGLVGGLGGHNGAGTTGFGSDYDDGADPVDADPYLHSLLDELMGTSQGTPSNMKWDPKLGWIETDTGMRMSEDEQYSQYMMMQGLYQTMDQPPSFNGNLQQ